MEANGDGSFPFFVALHPEEGSAGALCRYIPQSRRYSTIFVSKKEHNRKKQKK